MGTTIEAVARGGTGAGVPSQGDGLSGLSWGEGLKEQGEQQKGKPPQYVNITDNMAFIAVTVPLSV
jgi:hypothetical protein